MTFNEYCARQGDGHDSSMHKSFGRSKKAKAQYLGLSDKDIEMLKSTKVDCYDGSIDEKDLANPVCEIIDLDKLVGYAYHAPENWYDALDDSVFHKLYNLEKYDPCTFPNFISQAYPEDMPCVIEKDGKYYIYSGGNHRLTLAKITGCPRACVLVYRQL